MRQRVVIENTNECFGSWFLPLYVIRLVLPTYLPVIRFSVGLSLHVAKTILERTFIEMCIICEAQNVQTHCSVYYAQISLLGEGDMDMEKEECTLQSLMFRGVTILFCFVSLYKRLKAGRTLGVGASCVASRFDARFLAFCHSHNIHPFPKFISDQVGW